MIFRFLRIAVLCALAVLPATMTRAQTGSPKTVTGLNVETNGLWIDNLSGLINPFDARQTLLDIIASTGNLVTPGMWTAQQTFIAPLGNGSNGAPGLLAGETASVAAAWLLSYTDPYGPYSWFIGQRSGGAALFGNHSADYNSATTPAADLITSAVYAYHDNPANTGYFGVWANYWLAVRTETSYSVPSVLELESTFLNSGANVQGDPYNDPAGWNAIMRLDSGLPVPHPQNIVSTAIEVANIGSTFYSALKVNVNALSLSTSGFYEAIQLASLPTGSTPPNGPGHSIVWYSAPGTISGIIEVDTGNFLRLHGIGGIVAGDALTVLGTGAPTLINGAAAVYASTTNGGIFSGQGSSFDLILANKNGTSVCSVSTGTTALGCVSLGVGLLQANGAPPVSSGGTCTGTITVTGGPFAGNIVGATCTSGQTVILTGLPTAATGYACDAGDLATTATTPWQQAASSATTVTFAARASITNTDNSRYKCIGF